MIKKVRYDEFLVAIENKKVAVIGSYNIEYTIDLFEVMNSIITLDKLSKCSNLCNADWYVVDCINKECIEFDNYLVGKSFVLWVNDKDFEIWKKNDFYAIATVDEVIVIKVK